MHRWHGHDCGRLQQRRGLHTLDRDGVHVRVFRGGLRVELPERSEAVRQWMHRQLCLLRRMQRKYARLLERDLRRQIERRRVQRHGQ